MRILIILSYFTKKNKVQRDNIPVFLLLLLSKLKMSDSFTENEMEKLLFLCCLQYTFYFLKFWVYFYASWEGKNECFTNVKRL